MQENIIKDVYNSLQPSLYVRQVYFINFTAYNRPHPIWMNIIKDPLERGISNFYASRALCIQENKCYLNIKYLNDTFNDCVNKYQGQCFVPEQGGSGLVPFFCGQDPQCEQMNDWSLQTAKYNINKYYTVVGLAEQLYKFFFVLAYPDNPVRLFPCSNCGRNFNPESLRKHQPICKKVVQKQRKIFDAGRQRARDTDIPYAATKETTQIYQGVIKPQEKEKKGNWRELHHQLVRTIREARNVTHAIETGAPMPKTTPSSVPSGLKTVLLICETQFKRKHMQQTANIRGGAQILGRQHSHTQQGNNAHDINYKPPQINSAPTTLAYRRPVRYTNSGLKEESRRPPLNPNMFKKGTVEKYGRNSKTQSATVTHLMRTGRTTENDDLNVQARQRSGGSTSNDSPMVNRRITNRSPSPARQQNSQVNGYATRARPKGVNTVAATPAKHCHECGTEYVVDWAKFCCECGEKRIGL
ncbi:unnamed protein product [Didymodactylos carnosus]|uniref:C2HC/C3H-type domain-containing protein n=1 Tax=Didymodactylos carnosus TaxID=1234261 RepID=A0A8S2GZX2_9BILA|nr:unnamed protein product [Didymodactylos carnosus]CAF3584498.1 unnamed protein product [Didymodactylos carnosus]